MAFVSRIGNILKQAGGKHINIQSPGSNLSLYQAIRCMSSSKLFVGGISWNTDEQSLREVFAKYGEVIEARIIMDRESGRSRGFGFVSFTSTEEASSAIQALDNQVLHGRTIKVNFAIDKPRGGFGGGGNYGVGGGTYGGNYGGGNYQGGGGNYGGNYQGGGGSYGGNYQGGGGGGSNGGDYQGGGGSYEGTGNNYTGGNGNYSSGGVSSFDGGNSGNYVGGDGDNYFSGGGAGGDSGFTGAGGDGGFTGAGGDSGFTGAGYSSTTGTGGGDESFARDPLEVSTRDDFDEPDDVSNTKG